MPMLAPPPAARQIIIFAAMILPTGQSWLKKNELRIRGLASQMLAVNQTNYTSAVHDESFGQVTTRSRSVA